MSLSKGKSLDLAFGIEQIWAGWLGSVPHEVATKPKAVVFLKTVVVVEADLFACICLMVEAKSVDNPWYILSYKAVICSVR